jgi:hypothetical protein
VTGPTGPAGTPGFTGANSTVTGPTGANSTVTGPTGPQGPAGGGGGGSLTVGLTGNTGNTGSYNNVSTILFNNSNFTIAGSNGITSINLQPYTSNTYYMALYFTTAAGPYSASNYNYLNTGSAAGGSPLVSAPLQAQYLSDFKVGHNLPSSFTVTPSPVGSATGAGIYISITNNKIVQGSSDAHLLIPSSINTLVGTGAYSSGSVITIPGYGTSPASTSPAGTAYNINSNSNFPSCSVGQFPSPFQWGYFPYFVKSCSLDIPTSGTPTSFITIATGNSTSVANNSGFVNSAQGCLSAAYLLSPNTTYCYIIFKVQYPSYL